MNVDSSINYLRESDKKLSNVINRIGKIKFPKSKEGAFSTLAKNIIFQQLAGKAAKKIFERFSNLAGDLTPENVSNISIKEMRKVGLSERKAFYIKDLANHFIDASIDPRKFNKMSDDEIINSLTKVHGIGPWTAEMFLIFNLGRQDVFSVKDLGLHKAVCKLYGKDYPLREDELIKISNKWKPHRTLASLYLWKMIDNDDNW